MMLQKEYRKAVYTLHPVYPNSNRVHNYNVVLKPEDEHCTIHRPSSDFPSFTWTWVHAAPGQRNFIT